MKKKIINSLLIILFFGSFISNQSTLNAQEDLLQVEVNPIRINTAATYVLKVKFKHKIVAKEWLTIQWPDDTKMPELPEDTNQRRSALEKMVESIYIGAFPCGSCNSPPVLNEKERSLTFSFPKNIDPSEKDYSYTNIIVPDRLGFINPSREGNYHIKLSTASHGTMTSSAYQIVESKIGVPAGKPRVTVDPSLVLRPAAYEISFQLGCGGALISNQSRIRIRFPDSYSLNNKDSSYQNTWIKINQIPIRSSYSWNNNLLVLISPIDIENSGQVQISISKELGLTNPGRPGSYTLEVSTSEDKEWVSSENYEISASLFFVEIKPNKAGKVAQFDMVFTNSSPWIWDETHPVSLKFPEVYSLSSSIDKDSIEINHQKSKKVSIDHKFIQIVPAQAISTNHPVIISMLPSAQIKNPLTLQEIAFHLKTSQSEEWHESNPIALESSSLELKQVQIDPWNACEKASYSISLNLGMNHTLGSSDWISLLFPEAYDLPDRIDFSSVKIKNVAVQNIKKVNSHELKIVLDGPVESEELNIQFTKEALIKNPCKGNQEYSLGLSTSQEEEWQFSPPFFVAPPLPKPQVQWLKGKLGHNSWYTVPPLLQISASTDEVKIYYSWSESPKELFEIYRGDQLMPEGFYKKTLYYYAQDAYGESEIKQASLQVDTLPPQFEFDHTIYPVNYTRTKEVNISGWIEKQILDHDGQEEIIIDRNLLLNEVPVSIDEKGALSFSFIFTLDTYENEFNVSLRDKAGWENTKTILYYFDDQPPDLRQISPTPDSTHLASSIEISAYTKPFSDVVMNGKDLKVRSDGFFTSLVSVSRAGKNAFPIQIYDRFGNESSFVLPYWFGLTIQMQIGNPNYVINDRSASFEIAPQIIHQATYMPVRPLSELMHAELSIVYDSIHRGVDRVIWKSNKTEISMKVNSKIALVNNKEVSMPVAPLIVKNRLMAPLRWIIEQIGGQVTWNSKENKISIEYLELIS